MRLIFIVLLALTLQGCCSFFGLNCQIMNYPIAGSVTVLNECNNNTPNQITLDITLIKGNQEVGTSVTVPLVNGVGVYATTVGFPGVPLSWKRITSPDVCLPLPCDDPSKRCIDFRTETPTFPVSTPTIKNVVFVCACN